jgi:hypothetical protein
MSRPRSLLRRHSGAAQNAPGGRGEPQSTPTAAAPQPASPSPLSFSGVIFGSYNYQLPTTPAQFRNQTNNSFVIDRAYLTFRIAAGDRTSIRITTDVFQSADSTGNAYTVRAKYAYLQYEAPKFSNGAQVTGRIGILQNVLIEHQEAFWPRYLSQAATERAGYFSSADVGLASLVTLPHKWGEIYSTIVNGPGYTAREREPVQGLRRSTDADAAHELTRRRRSCRRSRSRRGVTRAPPRARS